MLLMVKDDPPVLLTVMDCAALALPTCWLVKVKLLGDKVTAAAVALIPVPESETI